MSSSLLSKAGLHCSSACSQITEPILAAAIGTREDVENFLRLGSRGYAWTVLFFAVSHDNVNTFRAIVEHSGGDGIFRILDGDGWTLLQGAVYFGAPRVTRMVLSSGGVDVNQRTLPAPLPEDPELLDRELTASDTVMYIDQDRCGIFMDSLTDTGRDGELGDDEVFWDADDGDDGDGDGEGRFMALRMWMPGGRFCTGRRTMGRPRSRGSCFSRGWTRSTWMPSSSRTIRRCSRLVRLKRRY